jgi:hypothetical protein
LSCDDDDDGMTISLILSIFSDNGDALSIVNSFEDDGETDDSDDGEAIGERREKEGDKELNGSCDCDCDDNDNDDDDDEARVSHTANKRDTNTLDRFDAFNDGINVPFNSSASIILTVSRPTSDDSWNDGFSFLIISMYSKLSMSFSVRK